MLANEVTQALAYDIALQLEGVGEPIENILKKYGLSREDFTQAVRTNTNFKRLIRSLRDQIKEQNIPFRLKARIACDFWLNQMDALMLDPEANSTAKVSLFQHMTKLAGYEPPKSKEESATQAVVINFNVSGAEGTKTLTLDHVADS